VARISSLLQETLAEIIRSELADPRLGMWTITGVQVSPDLAYATVAISTLAGGTATDACVAVLNKAAPLLWNRVRAETDLRMIPKLRFTVDRGGEFLDEIEQLLQQVPPPAVEPAEGADAATADEDE
jgi:ribosome-binding factor A